VCGWSTPLRSTAPARGSGETLGRGRIAQDSCCGSPLLVSQMARELDELVEAFRTRPLDAGRYTFAAADALVLTSVRVGGR
jgi:Transposase, Mutator family